MWGWVKLPMKLPCYYHMTGGITIHWPAMTWVAFGYRLVTVLTQSHMVLSENCPKSKPKKYVIGRCRWSSVKPSETACPTLMVQDISGCKFRGGWLASIGTYPRSNAPALRTGMLQFHISLVLWVKVQKSWSTICLMGSWGGLGRRTADKWKLFLMWSYLFWTMFQTNTDI